MEYSPNTRDEVRQITAALVQLDALLAAGPGGRVDALQALASSRHQTFLDREQLVPGLRWPQALENALGRVRSVAVLFGRDELGTWQKREMWYALDHQAREEQRRRVFPLTPVLLPGADPASGFLFLNTWVDLANPEALAAWPSRSVAKRPPSKELEGHLAVRQAATDSARIGTCRKRGEALSCAGRDLPAGEGRCRQVTVESHGSMLERRASSSSRGHGRWW
jgi:TIR domain